MESKEIIETKKLWKVYEVGKQKVNAICDVSIRIPRGKITCVAGSSGSGKSTLLALIGLLTYPTRGQVVLEGESMKGMSEITLTKYRKERFGFLFQSQYLLPQFTALENARLPLFSRDISLKEADEQTRKILEDFDLKKRINFRARELSGGEAQRVCIARALVTNPSILIADEPSSSIDSKLTDEFLQLISELKSKHQLTVIMASHDPQILEVSDKEIVLKDGVVEKNLGTR